MSIVQRILLVTRNAEKSDPLAPESLQEGYVSCGGRLYSIQVQFSPALVAQPNAAIPSLFCC